MMSLKLRVPVGSIGSAQQGQVLILFALMFTVFIGMLALVFDVGAAYSQRRFVQNAADAAAIAGGHLLGGSVTQTSDGTWAFSVRDQDVRKVVERYVDDNKGLVAMNAVYEPPTIEYLGMSGNLLATSPTGGDVVPARTARLRVTRRLAFKTLFAPVLGHEQMSVEARAVAGVTGIAKPQHPPANVSLWPMTRYDDPNAFPSPPASGCPSPVLFWSGQPSTSTGTTADWKQLLYLGQKSAFVNKNNLVTSNHDQLITEFDTSGPYPFTSSPPKDLTGSDVQAQLEHWFRNGYKGKLTAGPYVSPPLLAEQEPGGWQRGVSGDKVETVRGNLGSNVASAMRELIRREKDGTDSCGGDFAYVAVYLWGANTAEKWNKTLPAFQTTTGQQIDRVTFSRWAVFKVYDSTFSFPNSSQIYGYWSSVLYAEPPSGTDLTAAPPSPDGNVVHITE